MAEYTANAVQTVLTNQNVLFTETAICGNNSITHREGSGLITLRGLTCQPYARFRVTFGGNIAIPAGGDVEAISIAIAINGESVASSNMVVTPAAQAQFFNVARTINICVPAGCCVQVSVQNTSAQGISVENANLVVERTA